MWDDLFYRNVGVDEPRIEKFARWLRQNREQEIVLFHGTQASLGDKIYEQGLKRSSPSRVNSLQSSIGWVCFSVFPTSAQAFAKVAFPTRKVIVYAVKLKIKELRPDKDQLANRRQWSQIAVRDTLAHSFVFGHGARVKFLVYPYRIVGKQEY